MIKKKRHPKLKVKKPNEIKQPTKLGKDASDIFGVPTQFKPNPKNEINIPLDEPIIEPTAAEIKEDQAKNPRGRPQEHTEVTTKVTVILLERQIAWLDQLALNIRTKTKAAISRTEILRAMVSAVEDGGIDLSGIRTESEARQLILSHIKR